ncbi:MAG: hypothetical protein LBJ71_03310 [Holosporaceae bacterium]|jgi:hypothetical protein|nr:hypothetical protein [Holosporaceae bacterium]
MITYRLTLFLVLFALAGCAIGPSRPYNELDTFLSGDAMYVHQLQNQLMLDPDNTELQEKLNNALKDARNRRDKEINNDIRARNLQYEINNINANNNAWRNQELLERQRRHEQERREKSQKEWQKLLERHEQERQQEQERREKSNKDWQQKWNHF